jgi:hypothetical protein
MFAITEVVYRATQMRVDVLSMSFSTTQDSPAVRKAPVNAHAAGVADVASVGNDANNTVTYFPAAYPMLSVWPQRISPTASRVFRTTERQYRWMRGSEMAG